MEPRHEDPAPLSVLVVDPHADAADSLAELLRLDGHRVGVARTGEEALRAGAADVVLLELRLPDLDGCEVTRLLRAAVPSEGKLIVAAVTTCDTAADRQRAAAAGVACFFVKPSDPALLRGLLARLAGRADAAGTRAQTIPPFGDGRAG